MATEENVSEWAVGIDDGDVFEIATVDDVHPLPSQAFVETDINRANKCAREAQMRARAAEIRLKELENCLGKLDGLVFRRDGATMRLIQTQFGYVSVPAPEDMGRTAARDARRMAALELRKLAAELEKG